MFAEDKEIEKNKEVVNEELEETDVYAEDDVYEEEEEIKCIETETGVYPVALNDIELECIYLGLLFNNPKAISKFYFEYDCCHFSNDELLNLYKINLKVLNFSLLQNIISLILIISFSLCFIYCIILNHKMIKKD